MAEITIGQNNYRIGRLDAMAQFKIASKLSMALITLGNLVTNEGATPGPEAFVQVLCTMTVQVSDADRDAATMACLSVVQRQQGDLWSKVIEPRTGTLMFADIDLSEMLQLAWAVMREHKLDSFFSAPRSPSGTPPKD